MSTTEFETTTEKDGTETVLVADTKTVIDEKKQCLRAESEGLLAECWLETCSLKPRERAAGPLTAEERRFLEIVHKSWKRSRVDFFEDTHFANREREICCENCIRERFPGAARIMLGRGPCSKRALEVEV